MQLYRFTEFGRIASGLFHDLVNPLNLVILNLDEMKNRNTSKLLERAMIGTKQLESFVIAARQQMQHQEILKIFSLITEIEQTILMFAYKAKEAYLTMLFDYTEEVSLFGNPMKFRQIVTNLISNAIDSYDPMSGNKRNQINIYLYKKGNKIIMEVHDDGIGIDKKSMRRIFDPWYTTKMHKGTGIGLVIVKNIVEKDFKGVIHVESELKKGTKFIIKFPLKYKI